MAPRDITEGGGLDHVDVWIFDLDNTLYPASCRLFDQIDIRMGAFIQSLFGVDPTEAKRIQKDYFLEHGTTLRGLMLEHGQDARSFLRFVHDIDLTPVTADPALDGALHELDGRKMVFTNASTAHATGVMDRLGVTHHFPDILDIHGTDYVPKPHPSVYDMLLERFDVDPARAAFFEDSPKNLVPAAELGLTTIWIKTSNSWSNHGLSPDHIDYCSDDVNSALQSILAARR